jgi:hypothetical protein
VALIGWQPPKLHYYLVGEAASLQVIAELFTHNPPTSSKLNTTLISILE